MINLLEEGKKYFSTKEKTTSFVVDPLIGTLLLTCKKYNESEENLILYASNSFEANNLYNNIVEIFDKEKVVLFPTDDLIRVEYISESKEIKSEFLYSLYKIRNEKHLIIIVSPGTLFRFYPSVELFDQSFINLKVGDNINVDEFKSKLSELGYVKVSKIDQSLEFASRGEVIDVFSLNYENPIRIQLFDTEIESIRLFEIGTQTSYKNLSSVTIIPANINILNKDEKEHAKNKILHIFEKDTKNLSNSDAEMLEATILEDINDIENNVFTNKLYKYYGFLQNIHTSFLDYVSNYSIIVCSKSQFEKSKEILFSEARDFLLELQEKRKTISHLEYFNERAEIYKKFNSLTYLNPFYDSLNDASIPIRNLNYINPKNLSSKAIIELLLKNNCPLLISIHNDEEKFLVASILEEMGIEYSSTDGYEIDEKYRVTITTKFFPTSIEFLKNPAILVSSRELFADKNKVRTYSTRFKQGKILESVDDLEPGDYVVHEKYGIGRFNKIETVEVDGKHSDYIEVSYANNDKLYIPLYQFNLIRKYVGKEGAVPKLTNINTKSWEKTKKRIKERVNDLADRLLKLYQERANEPGFAFLKDDEIQKAFESDFKHELTPDQKKSIDEIKKDMESPHPMDRLLCGDVGFGKTEVAFEVTMKAILSEKQVLILCPTTVLAMQHYKVAQKRFKNFKINIALFTRMQTAKEQTEILKGAKNGEINLIIGTHKALGNKLEFKDLGLLIIDEEQRFGVEQKEKIKEKYKNIDCLTLSATPIPRTLQSSLIGLKNISKIETPPNERLPIQTYVINYDEDVISELIKRELSRRGQIYYVYNDIDGLYKKQITLQAMVPEARIGIIHGKMDKEDVDIIMDSFYEGEIDLLLSTTIIENGIDVRNANLLLIENADKFGLAQLYQIKGRVGRGDKIAYAYLMIRPNKEITPQSKKRLKAIQDFTELGSGYKIAQRDLLIRGAGDILGKEQAGFIDEVGIDLYIRLLNETIKEKEGKAPKINQKPIKSLQSIDAYIPQTFAENDDKIEIYQKIISINNVDELNKYQEVLTDQYGKLPNNVELLFKKREIDIYFAGDPFDSYNDYKDRIDIKLNSDFSNINGIGSTLFTALIIYINKIKVSYREKQINISVLKISDWLETLIKVLSIIRRVENEVKGAKIYEDW